MTYNINSDTNGSNGQGTPLNNTSLTTVLQAIGNGTPIDVLALEELSWVGSGPSPTLQTVVNDLDSVYPGSNYAYDPTYDPTDGNDTGNGPNGLIYNTATVTDLGAVAIGTVSGSGVPRAPMQYTLQPKLGNSSDTFYLYVSHAKSGTSGSDATRRNDEAQELRSSASTLGASAHIIYAGDFNINGSSEQTYQTMIASGTGQALDVSNTAGNWTDSSAFAGLLTESASNLEYRDDFQFVTAPMTSGSGGMQLVPGSYKVFGNNGTTAYGTSVNQSSNTALSYLGSNAATVRAALTTAIDHLPVVADYSFPSTPATISLGGVLNATIITGGTATVGATVTNTAAAGANNLNYTLGAVVQSGSATLGAIAPGSSGSLAPSASQTCTVPATSTNLGANTISFTASDPNSSNLTQTATATLTVLGHAAPSVTVISGNGFLAHAGATGLSATVSVSNAMGTRSDLEVASAPTVSDISLSAGPATPYYVSAGSAQTYTASFNAGSTPGVFSRAVTFASVGDNQSLPGANSLGSLSVSITGNVYSGQAQWNVTSGSWGADGNWKDTVGGGASGAPGVLGYATDTATFASAVASGPATVSLDGAAPVLSNLIFSNSNASYTILQGTGATGLTLTGTGGSSPAAMTVISGTDEVDTPIVLDSSLIVNSSGRLTLGGSLSDGGMGYSLTLDGGGELTLDGTGNYLGGTVVKSGTFVVDSSSALADGSSLTIGASDSSIFTASAASTPSFAASRAAAATVPEPGTLVLLGAMGIVAAAAARKRKNKKNLSECLPKGNCELECCWRDEVATASLGLGSPGSPHEASGN